MPILHATRLGAAAVVAASVSSVCALASPDLQHMRAAHLTSNYGALENTAHAEILDAAKPITARSANVFVSRSKSQDGPAFDGAFVRLVDVTVGDRHYTNAGFWVSRNVSTQDVSISFMPSADTSLVEITGFNGDVIIAGAHDASWLDKTAFYHTAGPARDYVSAVINAGAALLTSANFTYGPDTPRLDAVDIGQWLDALKATIDANESALFRFLDREHVEWVMLNVPIFNDSIADPVVRVHYRGGDRVETVYTFDDADLEAFIGRLRRHGLKVVMSFEFYPVILPVSTEDPTCNTPQYKPNRWLLGQPTVAKSDPMQACINPAYWWWNPAHADYAKNVALFWSSYTDVAVRYAKLASRAGVDMFCLGTEEDNLFRTREGKPPYTNHFLPFLTTMVSQVRAVYSGPVFVEQSWTAFAEPQTFAGGAGNAEAFRHVPEDLGLDVVAISAYPRLGTVAPTDVQAVSYWEAEWQKVFSTWVADVVAANPGKPLIFSEMGYTDDVAAPYVQGASLGQPTGPRDANGVTRGMQQQRNVLQAFYNVNERNAGVVKGAFLWGMGAPQPQDCGAVTFGVYCKPAADTVRDAYGSWAGKRSTDHRALWWNPSEDGWGVSFTQHDGVAFVAFFTYDSARRALWYVVPACPMDSTGCSGDLYSVSGGTPPGTLWSGANLAVSKVGTARFTFSDADNAIIDLAVNGVQAQKKVAPQYFRAPYPVPWVDYTDLWWNAQQSGWGVALTHLGATIFATWYAYAPSGAPVWYVASNCPVVLNACTGDLYEVSGGSALTTVWSGAGRSVTKVGSVSFSFPTTTQGSMTYTIGGATATRSLTRQPF